MHAHARTGLIQKNQFNCLVSHIQIVLSVRVIQFRGCILTGRHSEASHSSPAPPPPLLTSVLTCSDIHNTRGQQLILAQSYLKLLKAVVKIQNQYKNITGSEGKVAIAEGFMVMSLDLSDNLHCTALQQLEA